MYDTHNYRFVAPVPRGSCLPSGIFLSFFFFRGVSPFRNFSLVTARVAAVGKCRLAFPRKAINDTITTYARSTRVRINVASLRSGNRSSTRTIVLPHNYTASDDGFLSPIASTPRMIKRITHKKSNILLR